jgi:type IX secretion system PorP/SprF family membrane protein
MQELTRTPYIIRLILPVACAALSILGVHAQDHHFSQFYETPMLRNPSLAGLFSGDIRLQGVYRNQWNSISFPFQTGSFNAEYKFAVRRSDDFMTLGMQVHYDRAGAVALSTNHLLPAVNYHKSLSQARNTYLSLGFMGGPVSRRLDRSSVTTNNQYDGFAYNGSLPDGEYFKSGYTFFDLSVGMSINSTIGSEEQHSYFAGIAYHHLNRPVNAFYRNINHLPKWVWSAGIKLMLQPGSYLTLHGDYVDQKPHRQLMTGGMYTWNVGEDELSTMAFHGGMFYRWNDALVPVVKIDLLPFSMSFSYDVTVGKAAGAAQARGGFELSMSYVNYLQSEQSARYRQKCPRF